MNSHPCMLPDRPLASRFVAPWDTSGWYELHDRLRPGVAVYTNSGVTISQLPDDLIGGEWIATFDSFAEGFDDKGGMDFFAERALWVILALDPETSPDFLPDFARRPDRVTLSDGRSCALYQRRYHSGEQVTLPAFQGNCHHYFVMLRAAENEAAKRAPQAVSLCLPVSKADTPKQKWYIDEHFCRSFRPDQPHPFQLRGRAELEADPHFAGNHQLCLSEDAVLSWNIPTTGRDRAELALTVAQGQAEIQCCGVTLQLSAAGIRCGQVSVPAEDGTFHLILIRSGRRCEVQANLVHVFEADCEDSRQHTLSIRVCPGSEVRMDAVSLRDHFEAPLCSWSGAKLQEALSLPGGCCAGLEEHPALGPVLQLQGAAVLPLPVLAAQARLEIIARPSGSRMTLLADVRDPVGNSILQVCSYHHNLYATDGGRWSRLLEADKPHSYDPADCWYHLSLEIHLSEGRYTLLADGARRAVDFRFASDAKLLGQLCFSSCAEMSVHSVRLWDAASVSRGILPPGPVFDVKQAPYCAVGDGVALDTAAIQQAMDDASCAGGTVLLHDGTFLVSGLELRSNLTLWIDPTATIQGHADFHLNPVRRPCESLIAVKWVRRGVLYGERLRNVRILGGGIIDANGRCRFKVNNPVQEDGSDVRPSNLFIAQSEHLEVRDIHLTNAAFWTLVPLSCRHVLLEDLDLDCMNTPNRDGIDPVDCRELAVRRCRIQAGDDGFCPKSSYVDGCRHILAEDLVIQSLASGIKFGTDSYCCFSHITVRRCILKNVNRCGVAIETVDGAEISDIRLEQLDIEDSGGAVYMTIGCRHRRMPNLPLRTGRLHDVSLEQIHFSRPYPFSHAPWIRECMIIGLSEEQAIENVRFERYVFRLPGGCREKPDTPHTIGSGYPEYDRHGPSAGSVFTLMYAKNIQFTECDFTLDAPDVRPMIAEI